MRETKGLEVRSGSARHSADVWTLEAESTAVPQRWCQAIDDAKLRWGPCSVPGQPEEQRWLA